MRRSGGVIEQTVGRVRHVVDGSARKFRNGNGSAGAHITNSSADKTALRVAISGSSWLGLIALN